MPAAEGASDAERASVVRAPVPMLLVDLPTRLVLEVSDTLLEVSGSARSEIVGTDVTSHLVGPPNPALPLLVTGQIDGYETTRRIRYPAGRTEQVHVWAHAFGDERPPRAALFVVDDVTGAVAARWSVSASGVTVLGAVDAAWRVERVSADVEALLGYTAAEVIGQTFLAVVHPGDLADLLTGLGHTERSGESVVLRLRLMAKASGWQWCRAWVASLDEPKSFGFMLRSVGPESVQSDLAQQLHERLSRIAFEVDAATALTAAAGQPGAGRLGQLVELTSRELQVVAALQRGARGADVAKMLNLSPSTVRNHLASAYRKFGVSSQVELLAALRRQSVETDTTPRKT